MRLELVIAQPRRPSSFFSRGFLCIRVAAFIAQSRRMIIGRPRITSQAALPASIASRAALPICPLIEIYGLRSEQASVISSQEVVLAGPSYQKVQGFSAVKRPAQVPALVGLLLVGLGLLLVGGRYRQAHASPQPFRSGRADPFRWTVQPTSGIA